MERIVIASSKNQVGEGRLIGIHFCLYLNIFSDSEMIQGESLWEARGIKGIVHTC